MKIRKSTVMYIVLVLTTLCITFLTSSCAANTNYIISNSKKISSSEIVNRKGNIIYTNKQYSFVFTLPNDWKGYTILSKTWKGVNSKGKTVETGPAIVIRNSQWTSQNPYADIPLLVFSFDQLSSLQNSKFTVRGFCGDTISGANGFFMFGTVKYIFLAPEFIKSTSLPGTSEVSQILYNAPLHPTEDNILQPIKYHQEPITVTIPSKASVSSDYKGNIIYKNKQFGFQITLPSDWKGFTLVNDTWVGIGTNSSGDSAGDPVATGSKISIRNPNWTSKVPYQDIPIMIYTISQWNHLQSDLFSVSAAPINPSELARNGNYVFALPARYNYAFPKGYQEVSEILSGHALKPLT